MSQTQEQIQTNNTTNNTNEIQIKKRVILYIHNDSFNERNLEPLLLINNERIHIIMLKKKWNNTMYYIFEGKKYMKLWNDKNNNILTFIGNWIGDLFVSTEQTEEYIDPFHYTAGNHELECVDRNGNKKKLLLNGFNIIPIAINQFHQQEDAIFYILCNKLS